MRQYLPAVKPGLGFAFAVLSLLLLLACTGPQGDTGLAGNAGNPGNPGRAGEEGLQGASNLVKGFCWNLDVEGRAGFFDIFSAGFDRLLKELLFFYIFF